MPAAFRINDRALARIAEAATLSVPGSVAVDAKLAGLAGRGLPRVEARVNRSAATVSFSVDMAVSYPSPVVAVTEAARAAVRARVATLTGFGVTQVDLTVVEARHQALPVTRDEVERHPADITPTPVTFSPRPVFSPTVRSSSSYLARPGVPAPRPLRRVEAPPAVTVRPVAPPPPIAPRRIERRHPPRVPVIPAPLPVRSVRTPEPVVVRVPRAPQPGSLSPITTKPVVSSSEH